MMERKNELTRIVGGYEANDSSFTGRNVRWGGIHLICIHDNGIHRIDELINQENKTGDLSSKFGNEDFKTIEWDHYQWYKDGASIPNAHKPLFFARENGVYTVTISDFIGGSQTTSPYTVYGMVDITEYFETSKPLSHYLWIAKEERFVDTPFVQYCIRRVTPIMSIIRTLLGHLSFINFTAFRAKIFRWPSFQIYTQSISVMGIPFLKKLPKGYYRLSIVGWILVPLVIAVYTYTHTRTSWEREEYMIKSYLISVVGYYVLCVFGIWVYEGFKESTEKASEPLKDKPLHPSVSPSPTEPIDAVKHAENKTAPKAVDLKALFRDE